jgi:predicted 2-oxoglutarate/Fe(II)-dependent dioxygenase YbiX
MSKLVLYSNVNVNLEEALRICEGVDWQSTVVSYTGDDGEVVNIADKKYRNADLKRIKFLQQEVFPELQDYVKNYTDKELTMESFALVRYVEGQFFKEHADRVEGAGLSVRELSVVVYLNDDYEGGEIYFRNQGLTIKPAKNSMVMFPSTGDYLHEARPIISGTKYVFISFWV